MVFLPASCDEHEVIDYDALKKLLASLHKGILSKRVITAGVVKEGGVAAAISAMCLGNELGFPLLSHSFTRNVSSPCSLLVSL